MNPQQLLQTAITQHQTGQLIEAEMLYRQVLTAEPDNFNALHLLGLIALHREDYAEAAKLIGKAITIKSDAAPPYYNLGIALQGLERFEEAAQAYLRAIEIDPAYAEAHNNLGNVLKAQHQPAAAEACYRQALAANPNYADAFSNLGNSLLEQRRLEEAAQAYRQALKIDPNLALARHHLNSLEHVNTERAPADYVSQIFDDYAEHFDRHLTESLGYKMPRMVADALREQPLPPKLDVLDLGCALACSGWKCMTGPTSWWAWIFPRR